MLPEDQINTNKLGKKYYIYFRKKPEHTHETTAKKSMRLVRERKQTFKKNLKSFIGGN